MVAQVAVVNPGFSEALESLARLGRTIDQAIQAAIPSLQLPRFSGFGFATPFRNGAVFTTSSLSGAGDDTAHIGGAGTGIRQALSSVPVPQFRSLVPPLPGLDSLQALSRSIADALSVTFLPRFDDLSQAITQCCAELAASVSNALADIQVISKAIEACKCTTGTEEIKKHSDRISDGIREVAKPTLFDRLRISQSIGSFVGLIVGLFRGDKTGKAANLFTTGAVLGGFYLYDDINPDPFAIKERSKKSLDGLKDLSEPLVHRSPILIYIITEIQFTASLIRVCVLGIYF